MPRSEHRVHREVVSYVRRSARMNPSQAKAWETHAPRLVVTVPPRELSTSVHPDAHVDWEALFGRRARIAVEIGSGRGEALVALAELHPDWNIVAFEVFQPAVASTLSRIARHGVDNVRIVLANGVEGLERLFPPRSITELWTFFPDPWHKPRHHKRRLVSAEFAALAASRLTAGGVWRLATDWADYADAMRAVLDAAPGLVNAHDGWAPRFAERPVTKYEDRGLAAGRTVRDLEYRPVPRVGDLVHRTPHPGPRTEAPPVTATTRYRLDLAYDGAAFHGWASQDGLRTVQGELEHWLTTVLRLETPAQLTVAGRTDAGVHARGQVAHVDLPDDDMPPAERAERLTRRLGRVLPPDVTVRRVTVAPEGFDARFSAIWRRYVYRLAETTADPLHRGLVHRVGRPLDVAAMDAAAAALVGLHDFVAFCKAKPFATTIRHVLDCGVTRVDEGELAGTVAVEIRADAFCHSMVRSVVGALVGVGLGQHDAAWLERHVRAAQRARDIKVMPARGLVLEEVGYPADDQLAARASQARARRDEQSCPDEPSSDQPNSEPPSSPEPPTKEPS